MEKRDSLLNKENESLSYGEERERDTLSVANRKSTSSSRWRRETQSPLQREGVCHPLDEEERDILSYAERRSVCHPLDGEERHTLLCREKEYVILLMEKRDTLSSAKIMSGVDSILPYTIYSLLSTLDTLYTMI